MEDIIIAIIKLYLFLFVNFALSTIFSESSFMSVNLLILYTANVIKKEARSKPKSTLIP